MEEKHRKALQDNYELLVSKVNLRELLPRLIEGGVFSLELTEYYRTPNIIETERKRKLFLDISRRGPLAFDKLVESLKEINYGHKMLAYKLQGKDITIVDLEVENNNCEPIVEIPKPMNVTNGAYPFILTEEQRPPHIRQLSLEIPNANINLAEEPLTVKVKVCERWWDNKNEHKVPVYPMRSKQRGLFLCINNIEFPNDIYGVRSGAEVDETNLKDLFKQLGFGIQIHRNLSKRDMKKTVDKFCENEKLLRAVDCIVVAVMSHGTQGHLKENTEIVTSDGQHLPVSWLLEQFYNRNCPALINKPKIFLLQICRGNNPHVGVQVQSIHPQPSKNRTVSDGIASGQIVRDAEDMLIAFSTLPGDRSFRDTELGTWYMQAICKAFMNHAYDTDIEHLLKIVDAELKQLRSEDGNMQTSTYENRGFKLCYLHPGIYQDENNMMKYYNNT